jgi:D-threo-aldose 1-dehydrogenase
MDRVCTEHGTNLATAALQASVRDSRISTTVIGLSSPKQLDSLLAPARRRARHIVRGTGQSDAPREHWLDFRQH